jgi:glycosyltransferase involved in cell wall biosynthesis
MESKNQTPLVSVSCLVYNHEPYLRQCLDGFVMQKTNFPFEVIVHDDASTDRSADIIREYVKKYPDLFVPVYQTENQYSKGIGVSVNHIYPKIRGKYMAKCEGDDYWIDPLKLQKQVNFLEKHEDYALVFTNVSIYLQDKDEMHKELFNAQQSESLFGFYRSTSFEDHLIHRGYIAPCTWVVRKEFLLTKKNKNYKDNSFAMILDIFAKSKIHYMQDVTAVYRVLSESVSHSFNIKKMYSYSRNVFELQKDYADKYKVNVGVRTEMKHLAYSNLILGAILTGDKPMIKEAKDFLLKQTVSKKIRFILLMDTTLLGRFLLKKIYQIYKRK